MANFIKFLGTLICVSCTIQASPFSANSSPFQSKQYKKTCIENADRVAQADPGVSAFCESCNFVSPKADKVEIKDLDSFLLDGVQHMNDQLNSYTSKNSKLGRAIFIMGNSRSGKTAVAQMLSQNLNNLQASYTEKGVIVFFEKQSRITDPMAPFQNIVPDLMLNSENKMAFWNCPAFADATDPEADVAAKYFLQIALSFTSRAKFIFTVSHSAVKVGSDGKEFDYLVTNFINLFKNLSRWEDSIGLVVVKGEIYGEETHYQSDEQIVSQIHKSLEDYLSNQKKLLKNEERQEHRSDFERKIQFVEGILGSKRQSKSAKLYILQFPQTCGPLDKMSSVRKSKDKITELYQKKLAYSSVTTEDFQITFTNESYMKLNKSIIPIALENLEALVAGIANDKV